MREVTREPLRYLRAATAANEGENALWFAVGKRDRLGWQLLGQNARRHQERRCGVGEERVLRVGGASG